MTIPGVDMVVALAIVAAIGNVGCFEQSQKLVSYLGLNPFWLHPECAPIGSWARVSRPDHEAGPWACARHARPRRLGRQRERRVRWGRSSCESGARRGQHVAAVATARKLAVLIWHLLSKGESYVWARPALHARKLRDLELKAGYKAARGQRGAAHAYNIKSHRDQERRWVEQAETAYARFVSGWNPRGPKRVRTRAPQPRCDDEGCAAGPAPRTLLFAHAVTRPCARGKLASDPAKKHLSITSVVQGAWAWSGPMIDIVEGRRRIRRHARGRAADWRSSV